jgi:hypothetical protein
MIFQLRLSPFYFFYLSFSFLSSSSSPI